MELLKQKIHYVCTHTHILPVWQDRIKNFYGCQKSCLFIGFFVCLFLLRKRMCARCIPCFQKKNKIIFPFHLFLTAGMSSHHHKLWMTSELKACSHCMRGVHAALHNHCCAVIFALIPYPDKQKRPNQIAPAKWKGRILRGYSSTTNCNTNW